MLYTLPKVPSFEETTVTIQTPAGNITVRQSACRGSNAILDIDLPDSCKIVQVDECEL